MNTLHTDTASSPKPISELLVFLDVLQYYGDLISDLEIATAPFDLHDRKSRRQMVTLLSRPGALLIPVTLYKQRRGRAGSNCAASSADCRLSNPAAISRLLWRYANLRGRSLEPSQAQRMQANRIVRAALAFQLVEPDDAPNKKEKVVKPTHTLENLIDQLLSFADWQFKALGQGQQLFAACHP